MISAIVPFMNSNPARLASFYFTMDWIRSAYKGVGEIIVVMQGEPVKVPDYVTMIPLETDCPLMLKAACVNLGAAKAKGDMLLIHDSDTVLPGLPESPDEKTMLVPLKAQSALGLPDTLELLEKGFSNNFRDWAKRGRRRFGESPGGVNLISKSLFNKAGGFDELHVGHGGQDYDFAQRVRTAGGRVVFPKDHYDVGIHLWHPIDTRGMLFKKDADAKAAIAADKRMAAVVGKKLPFMPMQDRFEAILAKF